MSGAAESNVSSRRRFSEMAMRLAEYHGFGHHEAASQNFGRG